ncbi:HTH_Tnp_Tc3_2 domain-containing protein [Trichonephila clavipes]|nr:HTH_Tnp_Tc3_2 domain-containing protein [Trichonephila clavipes]
MLEHKHLRETTRVAQTRSGQVQKKGIILLEIKRNRSGDCKTDFVVSAPVVLISRQKCGRTLSWRSNIVCCTSWKFSHQLFPDFRLKRRPGSGHPRQTSRREDHHIVRNAHVLPTASSAAIQAQVVPSLGVPVSSRTMRKRLAEGHFRSRRPLRVLPLTPPFGVVPCTKKLNCRSSLATNPDSISAVMTIVFVCGDPVVNVSVLHLPYSDTPLPQLV